MIMGVINYFEVGQQLCRLYSVKCLVHKHEAVKVNDVKHIK